MVTPLTVLLLFMILILKFIRKNVHMIITIIIMTHHTAKLNRPKEHITQWTYIKFKWPFGAECIESLVEFILSLPDILYAVIYNLNQKGHGRVRTRKAIYSCPLPTFISSHLLILSLPSWLLHVNYTHIYSCSVILSSFILNTFVDILRVEGIISFNLDWAYHISNVSEFD